MKTQIKLIILLSVLSFSIAKAQLPNTNMENWVTVNGYDSLIGWTSNNFAIFGPNKNVFKVGNNSIPGAYQGSYAAMLMTSATGIVQSGVVGILVNGQPSIFHYPTIGMNPDIPYAEWGGTPINYKPTHLTGYYTFNSTDTIDKGVAYILLSKYNSTKNKRDTVGFATHYFLQPLQNAYVHFSIPITDFMPGVLPDTITTIFYSSNPNTVKAFVTSNLYIDALTLTGGTGIEDENNKASFAVYPNPIKDKFTVELKDKMDKLFLTDINGRLVKEITIKSLEQKVEINIEELNNGVYFLSSSNGYTYKLIKQ